MPADLLTELTGYLATAASLVVGTTLFRGGLPADGTATVSAVIPTGGVARGENPKRQSTCQIITRGVSLALCNAQADAIYAACLDARKLPKLNFAMGALKAERLEPLQPPASIGLDAQQRMRTTFNILIASTE